MQKKVLALLLCSAVAVCGVTGCGREATPADSNSTSSAADTGNSSETNYNTMKPPESGWTMEELLSVTYLCGRQLSYPLTTDDLGDDFTISTDITKIEDRFVTNIDYKGQYMAPCVFGAENNTEQELKNLRSFAVDMPENAGGFSFNINGAGFESSKEEVRKALGLPDDQSTTGLTWIYSDRQNSGSQLSVTFKDDRPIEFSFDFR